MSPIQDVAAGLVQQDSAVADSVSAFSEIGDEVRQLGELIVDGEWALAWDRFSETTAQGFVEFIPDLLSALFVGGLFYVLYRIVFRVASRLFRGRDRSSSGLRDLVLNAIRFLGLSFVVLLVLAQLGLDITAAVAGLGILGLALGFAAKDSLENFLAGVTIIMDRPFDVGDMVEIGGTYGTVIRFTLRSTRIRTPQRRVLVMPNVSMITQPLLNHSGLRFIRVDIPFGIAYKEDIEEARRVVLAALPEDDRFVDRVDPQVVVTELGDSSVNMQLRVFIEDASEELPVRWEYVERVRVALREADIEIPFPHLQLFIDEAKAFQKGVPGLGDRGER
ncbi:MAG: mechanosensitive ion channel family protein [Gemmatimonadota bacterium]|nr:mechanosensitive ion channel family protein [Gemmatimonadota bacterium]